MYMEHSIHQIDLTAEIHPCRLYSQVLLEDLPGVHWMVGVGRGCPTAPSLKTAPPKKPLFAFRLNYLTSTKIWQKYEGQPYIFL